MWQLRRATQIPAFIAIIAASAVQAADSVKVQPPLDKVLSSANGRFVFGQISEYRRDQYLLDTQTGRLWKVVLRKLKNPDGTDAPGDGYEVLQIVSFIDENGNESKTPK